MASGGKTRMQVAADTPVRIHKSIALLHPAASLWYLCHAADPEGRGRVELSASEWLLLKVSRPTLYRWLREGWALGLFRNYWWKGDRLTVSLGGLKKACLSSGMESWGPVATVRLGDFLGGRLRALASAIQTQDLQERSRYAARHSLNELERKHFKVATAAECLNLSSPTLDCGEVPGLAHIGTSKIFVRRSFIPFGVSQDRICEELNVEARSCGVCTRTLRNHLKRLGVDRRQLVQSKPEYREIRTALEFEAQGHKAKGSDIHFEREGEHIRLDEPNGKSSARREGGHRLKPDRLFRYFGADWIYRCNLYGLAYELTSMKRSRFEYKRHLARNAQNPCPEPTSRQSDAGDATTQLTAVKLNFGGSQNKEEKNDNSLN